MLWNDRRERLILLQCGEASDVLQAGAKGVLLPIQFLDLLQAGAKGVLLPIQFLDMLQAGAKGVLLPIQFVEMQLSGRDFAGK